jgi:hypothetical protein
MDKQQLKNFITQIVQEQSDKDERYDKLFNMLLDKYDVDMVDELDTEERRDFFSDIESLWDESEGKIDKGEAKEEFSQEELDKLMSEAYFKELGRCGCKKRAINEVANHFTDVG